MLDPLGYAPVRIETAEGRARYRREQAGFTERAAAAGEAGRAVRGVAGMRSLVVCVLAALLLAGCTSRVGGGPEGGEPDPATGPVDLAVPIELRPVLETGSTDPAVIELPGEDGERLMLAEPILTIRRLDSAEITVPEGQVNWVLNIVMGEADGRTFGDWTGDHVGERLAMVADDEVLMAPEIQSAIEGGELQISAQYTKKEAQALLDKITGE